MEGNKVARQKVWVFSFALFPANQPSHCLLLTSIRPCIHPSPFLLCSFTLSGSVWDVKGILWVTVTHTHTAIITSAVQQKTSHHLRLTSPSSSFFILINFYFCLHVPPSSSTSTSSSSPSPSSALYFLIFFIIIIIIFLPEYFHVMLHNTFAPKNPPR